MRVARSSRCQSSGHVAVHELIASRINHVESTEWLVLKCEAMFVNGWPPFHVSNTDDARVAAERDPWSLLPLYQPGACLLGDVTADISGH